MNLKIYRSEKKIEYSNFCIKLHPVQRLKVSHKEDFLYIKEKSSAIQEMLIKIISDFHSIFKTK